MPIVRQVLLGLVVSCASGAAARAAAQAPPAGETAAPTDPAQPAEPAPPGFEEEILVTGSRIRRKDLTTPAPVTVIERQQIAEAGYVSIGEFLQHLPEQANGLNRQVNNGGDGSTRANLRGLGSFRTLVLLNGRRAPLGGLGADMSADLNAIPSAAVERIEILKDGASPMYGSEAIGGVVNIITRRHWSGAEATAYAGSSSRRDSGVYDFRLALGRSTEEGSLLLTAGFTRLNALWAGGRRWSKEIWAYDATGVNSPTGQVGPYRIGSPRTPETSFRIPGSPGTPIPNLRSDPGIDLYNQLIALYPSTRVFIRDPRATFGWRPYGGDALSEDGGDGYNYQPENYLVTPAQRLSLFAVGDVSLGRLARGFVEVGYSGARSAQKLAPEPFSTADTGSVVSADSVYNPFGVDLFTVRRRLLEFGHRSWSQDIQSIHGTAGFNGTLADATWTWEVSASYGRGTAVQSRTGAVRLSTIQAAIGPSFRLPSGQAVCGNPGPDGIPGTLDDLVVPGCVPLDLFGGPGTITADQVAGMTFDGTHRGSNEASGGQVSLSGDLFSLLARRPVGLALGYEYRRIAGTWVPDAITAAGDAADGGKFTPFNGSQEAHEGFAELSIPFVEGQFFAQSVEALAAARVFRYSGFGTDWTWKVGARWSPLRGLALRGTLSTAYRAPSINELFFTGYGFLGLQDDPCSGVDSATGAPGPVSPYCPGPPNGDPAPSYRVTYTGNPSVHPETARVFTAGAVLEPPFAPRLTVTVDAWGVAIANVIQNPDDGFLLKACYPMSASAGPRYCEFIRRDPATGYLASVTSASLNLGRERMAGLDLAVRYHLPTAWGRFGASFDGTRLLRYDVTYYDGLVVHGRGNYDLAWNFAGGVYPDYKFNAAADWSLRGLGAAVQVRYVGGFKECGSPDEVDPATGAVITPGGDFWGSFCWQDQKYTRRVSSYTVWNGQVSYEAASSAGRTSVALGVQNLFDRDPPRIYSNVTFGSDPMNYDFIGRFFYLRLTHRM